MNNMYEISVDNSKARSFNINIDYPMFTCFAINKAEALGKMLLSNWEYKNLKVYKIHSFLTF